MFASQGLAYLFFNRIALSLESVKTEMRFHFSVCFLLLAFSMAELYIVTMTDKYVVWTVLTAMIMQGISLCLMEQIEYVLCLSPDFGSKGTF